MPNALDDPEVRKDFVKQLLRVAAMGAMGGAAGRVGMGLLRDTSTPYDPPEAVKPMIVNMPYRVPGPVVGSPGVDPKKEKEVGREKYATPVPVSPVPPIPTVPAPSVNAVGQISPAPPPPIGTGAVPAIPPAVAKILASAGSTVQAPKTTTKKAEFDPIGGITRWLDRSIPYHNPFGESGAKDPTGIPLLYAAAVPLLVGGLGSGYTVADKILRAADRRKARGDLEDAQQEYQKTIIRRMAESQATDKSSAAKDYARTKQALDAAYGVVKEAQDTPEDTGSLGKLMARVLWPGLWISPEAGIANMGLSGAIAGLGGYAGYNLARKDKDESALRKEVRKVDEANAMRMPAPLIARMVPVSDQPHPARRV